MGVMGGEIGGRGKTSGLWERGPPIDGAPPSPKMGSSGGGGITDHEDEDAEAAPAQHGVVPRAPKQQPGQQRCDHPDGAGRGRGLIDAPLSPPQRVMG